MKTGIISTPAEQLIDVRLDNHKQKNGPPEAVFLFLVAGDIVSLQFISETGQKYFFTNGRTQGCYNLVKGETDEIYIAEFGLYLKATNDSGNTNSLEVQTMLIEAFGRQDGVLRPKSYSMMTKKDEGGQKIAVRNPAISLVGITTPSTFYDAISGANVADDFLGRFVIHQSNVERGVYDDPDSVPVPSRITNWIEEVKARVNTPQELALETPDLCLRRQKLVFLSISLCTLTY